MHEALYRKWRPKIFDDVIGQNHVTEVLKSEILSKKFSHAYLFTGSRGTGKTTCARILAKAINCLSPNNGNPCLKCEICHGIENGTILDITEIDAASNNGVENIRAICEESSFSTSSTKFRIYIIDEVHMLSIGAFNALLKILEEPPNHVIFILATTESHKVPFTIVSRCQRYRFNRISVKNLSQRIEYICKNEEIQFENNAINLLANSADGSARDAISLLDQCTSNNSKFLTLQNIQNILGIVSDENILDLVKCFFEYNLKNAILKIQKFYESSGNLEHFCEQLIIFFHNVLIYKLIEKIDYYNEDYNQKIIDFSIKISQNSILNIIDILKNTVLDMKKGYKKLISFECAIIKIYKFFEKNNKKHDCQINKNVENTQKNNDKIVENTQSHSPLVSENNPKITNIKSTVTEFFMWKNVLEILQKKSKLLYMAFLNSKAFEKNDFLLIDSENSIVFEYINHAPYREKILEIVSQITGKNYKLAPLHSELTKFNNQNNSNLEKFINEISNKNINLEVI